MDDFQGMIDSIVGVATGQQTTVRNLSLSLLYGILRKIYTYTYYDNMFDVL